MEPQGCREAGKVDLTRETLDSRYDDLKSGRVKPVLDAIWEDQGYRRPDLTSRPSRFTTAGNYLMHGLRNPRVMAAMPRGRE
jgi:hypothetical protein